MRNTLFVVLLVLLPVAASGQSVGVSGRAGTLGIGGEVTVGIGNTLQVRGGAGWIPFEFDGNYSDIDYHIEPTSPLANIGVDFFPGGRGFRIGGGLMFITNSTDLRATYTGEVDIGDQTYDGSMVGTLRAAVDHGSTAPYAVIGFGRGSGGGLGFFLDLGAAFLSDATIDLSADGPLATDQGPVGQQFRTDLERERASAQDDLNDYHRLLPIVSIGFRIGVL